MGGKKVPALGYPSRTDAVLGLLAKGKTHREIADMIGVDLSNVYGLEASGKKRTTGAAASTDSRMVRMTISAFTSLGPHARARNITPSELARRILETVAAEGMVDAVLDDGEGA